MEQAGIEAIANENNYHFFRSHSPVKPVISNREIILSRISDTLLAPANILKRCWLWLAEAADHHHSMLKLFVQHHLSVWSVVMTIDVDSVVVPTRNRSASAKMLAELLGVPWAGAGPFSAVYVNEGLTLDFIETEGSFAPHSYCFRVDEDQFNAILGRLRKAGIPYRSTVHGPNDMQISKHAGGGSHVYWNEPDGHQWEILTVSHAAERNELVNC